MFFVRFRCSLQSHEKDHSMNRGASKSDFRSVWASVRLALTWMISILAASTHGQQPLLMRNKKFSVDPGWDGHNNRATDPGPRQIVQNFGYSASTNAGGPAGEIGGSITPAGEPAFYGKVITPVSFSNTLSASGTLNVPQGGAHTTRLPCGSTVEALIFSRIWSMALVCGELAVRRSAERRPFQPA